MEGLKGQRILVTGGTGFVGSHLAEALVAKHARVVVVGRGSDPHSYFSTQHLERKVVIAQGDIKDAARMRDIVGRYEIRWIFHLGAQAIVTTAYDNPVETLESNIMGTVHVLEAARANKRVAGVIVASSDKAYGKSTTQYHETDPLSGDHPYEVSKSAADLITTSYVKTYGIPAVVTRFGNIYGPGDLQETRIVPSIMKTILTGEKLQLRSDGTYVRDYVYVDDVIGAYLFLLSHIEKCMGQAYNIASDDCLSVLDLIKRTKKIFHKPIPYAIQNTAKNEIPYQHLDSKKMRSLGWKPSHTLKQSLTETYRWYKKNKYIFG